MWKLLRVRVISALTLVVTSVDLSRILIFLFKRSFRHEIRHLYLISNFVFPLTDCLFLYFSDGFNGFSDRESSFHPENRT